jgi:hypothetical protein
VEAAAIAILTRAVDFLFEQGAEILRYRRERKDRERAPVPEPSPSSLPPPPTGSDTAPSETDRSDAVVSTRDDLLRHEIDHAVLASNEAEIRHLLALQETHTKNYHLAREQYAKWGDALVPPIVINNLEHEEQALAEVMKELRTKVGEVYGARIDIPGLDQTADG